MKIQYDLFSVFLLLKYVMFNEKMAKLLSVLLNTCFTLIVMSLLAFTAKITYKKTYWNLYLT